MPVFEPLQPLYSDSGGEWSPDAVVSAIRNVMDIAKLSHTAYFANIFQPHLASEVPSPGQVLLDADSIDVPFWFRLGKKRYYLPGSLRDLISYSSSVVACHAAIHRAWIGSGTDEDCGPTRRERVGTRIAREHLLENLLAENASPREHVGSERR